MYKVHFDGGLKQNILTYGYVLLKDEKVVNSGSLKASNKNFSSNVAEYFGLIYALNNAIALGIMELEVYGDSQLIIYQSTGKYTTKDPKLAVLQETVRILSQNFKRINFNWIPRENNEIADRMTR